MESVDQYMKAYDSDNDIITDFLNSNTLGSQLNTRSNMIPTINVTPQSPASVSKYSNIFDDTLSQLQNIRESVVKMKNSSSHMWMTDVFNCDKSNSIALSSSLPDLTNGSKNANNSFAQFMMWSVNQQLLSNNDRRKSWTAIDDIKAAEFANKSISLSSLDSEEQDNIRLAEQRRRSGRNSTGGISTHSLNEAELVRDFERITNKRNLATELNSRIPLQKSISTSSIIAKEDKTLARHLTDSEDENQGLLRAHSKIQIFDNAEKRRKRGSLFFRKKKEKAKSKTSTGNSQENIFCEYCGVNIRYANKDHQFDCKSKKSYSFKSLGAMPKKGSEANTGQDMYDGGGGVDANQFSEDTPLIKTEYYNDVPTDANDLGADSSLGIALKEHDSWSPGIPKELLKTLKEIQVKRQEHIYEFIMTEKHHCQTLLVIQKIFVESIERHFPSLNINSMFPRLNELIELHTEFLQKLREKQREHPVVDSISDILLDFFTLEKAQQLRLAYGEFCANHRTALEQFKVYMTTRDHNFSEWYKHCLTNPLLKKKGIPECILFVTQRLTKYPLLIEPLLKSAKDDALETDKLQHALNLVKALLVDVDACVAEKELRERQIDICQRIDPKSSTIYKNKPFRKADVSIETRRRLKFEGLATLMQGRSKMQAVLVVVLTDCLCFFCENSAHNKYTFFTPEHKAGVVPLQKLLIREKAGTESRGIYIISSNPDFPEMYELKVQQPKDKNVWIQSIRQAVLECPSSDLIEAQDLTAEEKIRLGVNKRELIEKMRQKDIEQAILLEEKLVLQYNLIKEQHQKFVDSASTNNVNEITNASAFLVSLGSYKDLVGVDIDTAELWKHVQNAVQEISHLATAVYSAATGLPVSRSIISVGDKLNEMFSSALTLPKRAETFAGFDDKRGPRLFPSKTSTSQQRGGRIHEQDDKSGKTTPPVIQQVCSAGQESTASTFSIPSILPIEQQNDPNIAALQITNHLYTLLCIISQQLTTIHNLQLQLGLYRENSKTIYTHNDQLEELRNLQDKLQEEKTAWLKQKEQQERELSETKLQQQKVQAQIKAEEEDIKQQREQLYRKMEMLSSQGLLLSPNTPLIINPSIISNTNDDISQEAHDGSSGTIDNTLINATNLVSNTSTLGNGSDRRKWRATSTMTNTPPVNLISATNAPKIKQTSVKQKIPIKLSSLSSSSGPTHSSKIDKSPSFSSPQSANVVQMFPLKLVDKRSASSSPNSNAPSSSTSHTHNTIIPHHSRTGSSPAVVQHPVSSQSNRSGSNTDTSSHIPNDLPTSGTPSGSYQFKHNYLPAEDTPKSVGSKTSTVKKAVAPEDDEIYF